MKPRCEELRDFIAENGALTLTEEKDLALHLSGCPECSAFLKASTELDRIFLDLREIDAPESAVQKVLETVGSLEGVGMEQVVTREEPAEVQSGKVISILEKPKRSPLPYVTFLRYATPGLAIAATVVISFTFLGQQASESFTNVGSSITGGVVVDKIGSTNVGDRDDLSAKMKDLTNAISSSGPAAAPPSNAILEQKQELYKGYGVSPGEDDTGRASRELARSVPIEVIQGAARGGADSSAPQRQDEKWAQSPAPGISSMDGVVSRSKAPSSHLTLSEPRTNEEYAAARKVQAPYDGAAGESYGVYEESPRVLTTSQPMSTFSIDIDTGSYTNARRFISSGQLPPPSSVRIEEFVNYFTYDYPAEANGRPFTLHYEIAPSPLSYDRHLLKLGIKANPQNTVNADKGWNLVFLIDVSGSMMDQNKLPLLKESFKALVRKMRSHDRVAIVTYAGESGVALDSTPGTEKEKIIRVIDSLGAGGSTNGAGGIESAYRVAAANRLNDGVNRVILATDGDFNVGVTSFDSLVQMVEEKRRGGITLTTLGFGAGNYNEQNLEQLANKGNGNYFYIDSLKEGERVLSTNLTSNMEVVAKDVKLQIEFNPAFIKAYRLIGYDNRKLRNQDFSNDAIDAGEIGAGHTVTALYEVILTGSPLGAELEQSHRYQRPSSGLVPSGGSANEFAFLKIRYKAPNGDTSALLEYPLATEAIQRDGAKMSRDFRFAAAVAGFGAILRQSQYVEGRYTLSEIRELAQGSLGEDYNGERRELLTLIERAQQLTGGVVR